MEEDIQREITNIIQNHTMLVPEIASFQEKEEKIMIDLISEYLLSTISKVLQEASNEMEKESDPWKHKVILDTIIKKYQ